MKKSTAIWLLSASMLLAACGKPADPVSSGNNEPTSSQQTPASSSKAETPSSSKEEKPVSSSKEDKPVSSSSSSQAPVKHTHAWVAGTKTGKITPETCDDHKAYRLDIADAAGWNKPGTKMNGKPDANGPTATSQSVWEIEEGQLPAGKYDIEIIAKMTYATHGTRVWNNMWETETESTGDKETESPFRYWVEIGDTKYDPNVTETWADLGYTATEFNPGLNAKGVTVDYDQTTIKLEHGNIGYSLIIESVRFVLIEEAPAQEPKTPVVTYDGIDLVAEADKAMIKITGTMENVKAANRNMAFALAHKKVDSVDAGDGGFLVGSETPADADYKYVPTVAADGKFEVKIDVSTVTLAAGAYSVYAGPKGFYSDITATLKGQTNGSTAGSQIGGTKVKSNGYKLYFRDDVNALIADELPPVELAEAFFEAGTGADEGKTFVLIGGTLSCSEVDFKAYTPFLQFQNTSSWTNTRLDNQEGMVEMVVRGDKGYVKANISSLAPGNYNTHLNIKSNSQADCKMDVELNTKETPFVNAGKDYAVYSNPAASQPNEFWGNLGVIVSAHPLDITEDTAVLEAENASTI
ncbi:MAG: hypothetical protein MJ238_03670, partial [Bacilli bacterium]|nr:hypothetical protein [Bacilli bacterium]